MTNNKSRAEFRFVIDGVELDDDQRVTVASAVQEAGILALSKIDIRGPLVAVEVGPRLKGWEIAGKYLLAGALAERVAPEIANIQGIQSPGS
ncbi:MAG: hypothetical protein ACRDQ2_01575 [Gaiellales bacterium]